MWPVIGILAATALVGGLLGARFSRQTLDQQYEERARAVAAAVATRPDVAEWVHAGDSPDLQTVAKDTQRATGAAYVVITDRSGIRFTHPNPALIGKRLEEPVEVLDGHTHVGIDNGSLGRSANGKAPVTTASGAVIGQVSVGILETTIAAELGEQVRTIALFLLAVVVAGTLTAWVLSRAIRRRTFGLGLAEVTSLLQDREAMLHGVREGVIGFDPRGRVSVLNDEARRLLNMPHQRIGEPLADELPAGRLRDLLTEDSDGVDQVLLTDDFVLVVNRRQVHVGRRRVGSVVTLRDRTELEAVLRELDSVNGLAAALRAQEHEFANRLHVIGGLLDLQETAEARSYVDTVVATGVGTAEAIRAQIGPPVIAALLLAKKTAAEEWHIDLRLTDDSRLDGITSEQARTVLTVIGNLVDNAMEAVRERPAPRVVTVEMHDHPAVSVIVSDNGPGVPDSDVRAIFTDGYSTKQSGQGRRRGTGLALVSRLVRNAGGTITVTSGPGARFEMTLPKGAPQ